MAKPILREQAISLRKEGRTYQEILQEIPVAKSTLSLWLRSVDLAKPQKQRLTGKKLAAARRGGEARRRHRIEETERLLQIAKRDIGRLSERELLLIGTALYWAEGTKAKPWSISEGVQFTNSDPDMIRFFLYWASVVFPAANSDISFWLFVHRNHQSRIDAIRSFWAETTGYPEGAFVKVSWKKHRPKTLRKNTGENYYGVLKVTVPRSTALNRQVAGWIKGITEGIEI